MVMMVLMMMSPMWKSATSTSTTTTSRCTVRWRTQPLPPPLRWPQVDQWRRRRLWQHCSRCWCHHHRHHHHLLPSFLLMLMLSCCSLFCRQLCLNRRQGRQRSFPLSSSSLSGDCAALFHYHPTRVNVMLTNIWAHCGSVFCPSASRLEKDYSCHQQCYCERRMTTSNANSGNINCRTSEHSIETCWECTCVQAPKVQWKYFTESVLMPNDDLRWASKSVGSGEEYKMKRRRRKNGKERK